MAGYQFPTDPMMGPSSPYGNISAKSSMFSNPGAQDPGGSGFEKFLNALGAAGGEIGQKASEAGQKAGKAYEKIGGTKALAGRYMPLAGGVLSLMANPTNIGGAAGNVAGGMLGGALGTPLGPIGMLAGSAIGSTVGGGLGTALQQGLVGGAQAATQAITGSQREAGQSAGILPGTSSGIGFSDSDIKRIEQLSKITGQSQVDIARQMLPVSNQYRDAEMQRQMQLNQQTGQITGTLNRQLYTTQLAIGAQSQAGATTREMLTAANPYASSAFQYRG